MAELAEIDGQVQKLAGAAPWQSRRDGYWMVAPDLDVPGLANLMNRLEARLSTMTGVALENGETAMIYHYVLGGTALNFKTQTHGGTLPSIAPITRAAEWIEREIHDLYGVKFTGHPNLARLVRPPQLAQGLFREAGGAASKK